MNRISRIWKIGFLLVCVSVNASSLKAMKGPAGGSILDRVNWDKIAAGTSKLQDALQSPSHNLALLEGAHRDYETLQEAASILGKMSLAEQAVFSASPKQKDILADARKALQALFRKMLSYYEDINAHLPDTVRDSENLFESLADFGNKSDDIQLLKSRGTFKDFMRQAKLLLVIKQLLRDHANIETIQDLGKRVIRTSGPSRQDEPLNFILKDKLKVTEEQLQQFIDAEDVY